MLNLTFRTATQKDLPEIKKLFKDTVQRIANKDYNPEQIRQWSKSTENKNRWTQLIEEQWVVLALYEQEIVGFISLLNNEYLDFMYVHHNYQRQGIAQALLEKVTEKAQQMGTVSLQSDVSITAKPFFLKNDFEVLRENHNERGPVVLVNYRMAKELTST